MAGAPRCPAATGVRAQGLQEPCTGIGDTVSGSDGSRYVRTGNLVWDGDGYCSPGGGGPGMPSGSPRSNRAANAAASVRLLTCNFRNKFWM